MRARAIAIALVLGIGTLAASAPALTQKPMVKPGQAGAVRLGMKAERLRELGLIGKLKPGCEFDLGQKVAELRPPLEGFVIFSGGSRRADSILVEGRGDTPRGVGIGDTAAEVREAYPNAEYDPPGSMEPFVEGFVWVNRMRNPRMTFLVDHRSRRVSAIALPSPSFCE